MFKNGLSKTDAEKCYLSNGTNKSIASFRETIPLKAWVSPRFSLEAKRSEKVAKLGEAKCHFTQISY
jgi:hypothetical protein